MENGMGEHPELIIAASSPRWGPRSPATCVLPTAGSSPRHQQPLPIKSVTECLGVLRLGKAEHHEVNVSAAWLFLSLRTFSADSATWYGHLRRRSARQISPLGLVICPPCTLSDVRSRS